MPTCDKCQQIFPNRMIIDGKERVLHKRRFCLNCSPFGKLNRRDLTKTHIGPNTCSACGKVKSADAFYKRQNGNQYTRCKQCHNKRYSSTKRMAKWRKQMKQRCVNYKGGRCYLCGYNKCLTALEFHHLDPNEKEFTIAYKATGNSFDTLRPELDKCVLLCANCHREVHDGVAILNLPLHYDRFI